MLIIWDKQFCKKEDEDHNRLYKFCNDFLIKYVYNAKTVYFLYDALQFVYKNKQPWFFSLLYNNYRQTETDLVILDQPLTKFFVYLTENGITLYHTT